MNSQAEALMVIENYKGKLEVRNSCMNARKRGEVDVSLADTGRKGEDDYFFLFREMGAISDEVKTSIEPKPRRLEEL